eukprot:tig00020610_g11985.t1
MLLGLSDAQTTGNTTTASLATTVKPAEQQSPSSSLADGSVPAAAAGAAIAAVVVGIAFIFIYRACYVNRKGRVVGAGMEAPAGEAFAQNPFSQLQTPASQPIVQGTVQITPQPRAPSLVDLSEDPRGEIRPASRTRSSDTADDYSSMDDSIAARLAEQPRPSFSDPDTFHLYLVMPKSRCTLERYIMAKERVAMPFLLEFSLDIARGMRYLHQDHRDGEPIAHRDLKTANILMMDSPDTEIPFCQLSDFGIARDASAYTGIVGTRLYMCPDGLKKKDYDPLKADVWSFGLVVMEMFTGLKPYGGTCSDDDIIAGRPFSSGQIDRLPDCLRNLVAACLSPSPVDRPSFARVVDHLEAAAKDVNAAINRNRPAENRSRYLTIDN